MSNFIKEFITYFFGTTDFALVAANFIFGCVGMFIMMLFDIMGRDKTAKYSPDKFSFKYFYKDNAPRFLLNFFIMLVCIRFTADFIKEPPTPKTSLLIGFLSDVIVLMVKKRKQKFVTDNEGGDGFTVTKTTTNTQEKSVEIKATPQSPIVPAVVCIIIAYSLLAMTGCTTARKATNYFNNHEDTAAGYCAVKYPVKTFTKTVTHTVQGKSDTVTVPGETVYADCSEEVIKALDNAARSHVAVKCPPTKIISKHDTTYVHDTTVSENTAQLRACQLKQNEIESYLQATIKEREKYKADKRTWQGRALWTWGILLLLIIVAIVLKWVSSKLP